MKRDYLGDSYDAVKRMWQSIFANWAPIYAEPRFIPESLREDFTLLTGIPMLADKAEGRFSILNDPDTGIRLPGEANQSEGSAHTHIAIDTIAGQLLTGPWCVITFDQSDYRNNGMKRDEQRKIKMRALAKRGFSSFYYVSHAPFLFATRDLSICTQVRSTLIAAGVPNWRLEDVEDDPNKSLNRS